MKANAVYDNCGCMLSRMSSLDMTQMCRYLWDSQWCLQYSGWALHQAISSTHINMFGIHTLIFFYYLSQSQTLIIISSLPVSMILAVGGTLKHWMPWPSHVCGNWRHKVESHPRQPQTKSVKGEWMKMVICLGHNKNLWSQRSKYKSYGALRVWSGGKGSSPCWMIFCLSTYT